ncbi:MAG TPA: hypothetical protein VGM50_13730 [Gemmatimonadaceae bacterium]|jgi:hypothetical protein
MSDEINVIVEEEAIRLLAEAGVSVEHMVVETGLETGEIVRMLAEPTTIEPVLRLEFAVMLLLAVNRCAYPEWAELIARTLWSSGLEFYQRQAERLAENAAASPGEGLGAITAFLQRQFGAEALKRMSAPPEGA